MSPSSPPRPWSSTVRRRAPRTRLPPSAGWLRYSSAAKVHQGGRRDTGARSRRHVACARADRGAAHAPCRGVGRRSSSWRVGHSPTQGTPVPGAYLTADLGSWSETPAPTSYTFQWLRDGAPDRRRRRPGLPDPGLRHRPHARALGDQHSRGPDTPTSPATALTVRKIGATLTLDVRRVHPTPGRARLVWMAISFMTTERPWGTDGGTVAAYKKKDGRLKELGRAVVTRGAAFVRLPWKKAPLRPHLRDGLLPRLRRGRGELLPVRRGAPRQQLGPAPNQPGAAATNASRSSAPAPSGITASSGAIRCRSSRLHRSASPGSAGQAPMTRPRTVRPRARSASTVSSVWLRVPSPAATTTTTSTSATASRRDGEVEQGPARGVEPDQQPAGALDDHRVLRERPRSGRRTTPRRGCRPPGDGRRCRGRAARRAWSTPRPRRR